MINFDSMLQRSLTASGRPVTLAMPFDVPAQVCRELVANGQVQSFVADSAESASIDPACAGWWVDRERGVLSLRKARTQTLLLAGLDRRDGVGSRVLLEARLKGVARVIAADRNGELIEDLSVEEALLERIEAADRRRQLPTFERAFERMYALVGDRLRLPAAEFRTERLALALGSLGPGGAERQGAYTAAGAIEHGKQVHILCSHIDPPADFFRPYVERRGAIVLRVAACPGELDDPALQAVHRELEDEFGSIGFGDVFTEIVRYASLLRAIRPALVHCWMDYCNALCGSAAALVGVPGLVLGCRSMAPDHFRIFQPYMRAAYRALMKRRSVQMLNNSRAGGADYARWLGLQADQVHVVHNGFEFPVVADDSRARVRATLGVPADAFLVGSVLRFSEEKRPGLLIDMAAEVHRDDPAARFVFYGGGVQLDEMRQKVQALGLDGIVLLPGVTHEAWDVLAAMDVFVLASRMEGLPNVVVEAQASGLPVVTTGVGGMPETYIDGETGLTVRDANPTGLATAVLRLARDATLRRRMSDSARDHARREFGIAGMIDRTLAAYARALRAGGIQSVSSRKAA